MKCRKFKVVKEVMSLVRLNFIKEENFIKSGLVKRSS